MTITLPFGPPTRYIDLADSRVPYYRLGSGPDVVFVHGWPLHAATFRRIAPALSKQFTCHLFDLPGCGASTWQDTTRISLLDYAAATRAVVDALGLTQYALVAHDSGAAVARLLAAGDARVRGVVVGNTEIPGHHPWRLRLLLALNSTRMGAQAFAASLRVPAMRHSSLAYGACFADARYCEGDFGELFVRPLLESARVLAGQLRLLESFEWSTIDGLAEVHGRIRAPVTLIWGERDPYFPLAKVDAMRAQFAHTTTLHVIRDAKLFCHEDFADEFAAHTAAALVRCFER